MVIGGEGSERRLKRKSGRYRETGGNFWSGWRSLAFPQQSRDIWPDRARDALKPNFRWVHAPAPRLGHMHSRDSMFLRNKWIYQIGSGRKLGLTNSASRPFSPRNASLVWNLFNGFPETWFFDGQHATRMRSWTMDSPPGPHAGSRVFTPFAWRRSLIRARVYSKYFASYFSI